RERSGGRTFLRGARLRSDASCGKISPDAGNNILRRRHAARSQHGSLEELARAISRNFRSRRIARMEHRGKPWECLGKENGNVTRVRDQSYQPRRAKLGQPAFEFD